MPPLQDVSDSESESDGEVVEFYEDDEDEPSAMLANDKKNNGTNVDLYDSGATSHMSPDRNHFTTYVKIPSKPIAGAGGSTFRVVGRRNMWIEVPMGNDKVGHVLLTNVHAGFTKPGGAGGADKHSVLSVSRPTQYRH
jgi:hypothetical protein